MDYQDFITYEEKAVMVLHDRKIWDILEDPRYEPIIVALREGPMTVKDLEERYNQIVTKAIENMDLTKKEKDALKEKMKRKSKTLYKYLDVLEKMNLIVQAGKRIKMGQTASETLYGRSAKLFLKSHIKKVKLTADELQKAIPVLAKIISMEKGAQDFSADCLANFVNKIYVMLTEERERIFNSYSSEITQIATELSYDELFLVVKGLEIYLMISQAPELGKELAKCFKK